MNDLATISLLLVAGFITPGPNNVIVMSSAARGGIIRAIPSLAIVSVMSGAMVGLAAYVARSLFSSQAAVAALTLSGSLLLMLLAAKSFREAGSEWTQTQAIPKSLAGLVVLQLVNPKGWIMTTTVAAAAQSRDISLGLVAPLSVLISGTCLAIWAGFGSVISRRLSTGRSQIIFDRLMASVLFATALGMLTFIRG
jgi:threonine/homoserine/homoserine lactone efflux protein